LRDGHLTPRGGAALPLSLQERGDGARLSLFLLSITERRCPQGRGEVPFGPKRWNRTTTFPQPPAGLPNLPQEKP